MSCYRFYNFIIFSILAFFYKFFRTPPVFWCWELVFDFRWSCIPRLPLHRGGYRSNRNTVVSQFGAHLCYDEVKAVQYVEKNPSCMSIVLPKICFYSGNYKIHTFFRFTTSIKFFCFSQSRGQHWAGLWIQKLLTIVCLDVHTSFKSYYFVTTFTMIFLASVDGGHSRYYWYIPVCCSQCRKILVMVFDFTDFKTKNGMDRRVL